MITWYAVYTRPHGEMAALENLLRQGYSVYLPRYRTRTCHARRVQTVLRPLFRYAVNPVTLLATLLMFVTKTRG